MKKLILLMIMAGLNAVCQAAGTNPFIAKKYVSGSFCIAANQKSASIIVSENEWKGVIRAAKDLQADIKKVTGLNADFLTDKPAGMAIIVGTIGNSKVIDQLIKTNKIDVAGISGSWESTLIEVVKNPMPGVDSALVIAGSDKRGTIYGIYELSYQIGVSPWYYWADVPVQKSNTLFAISGRHVIAAPAVKYRGIFLNDEAPALSGWSQKEFGGFNHKFYEKVFELILRLKGNYLWPAMWGNAFNDDDKMNPVLADEYGVVIGTSHHEPLTRAHDEWKRYKGGKWNYDQNPEQLRTFWESGLKRVADKEQIITVGMRGDGDEPMTEGTATALLEKIVKDQREIITKVTGKPASQTPQLWALYKEVQAYYDKGMRVPDDITLLLCDDNWGNIRKLPALNEAPRAGGYGIYYHFDYVGDPRNYKWVNTNPIQKIWEQMNLAYKYDANQIWIVNVGDLKPMEFPIEFFLDYAWAPDAIPVEKLKQYTIDWCSKQFGEDYALATADILDYYSKYNGRIKPELLNEDTYSLVNYNEFETVVHDYKKLENKARYIYNQLPANQKDAYYQLVLHPVEACANLNELYYTVARNKLYAKQGRVLTNSLAAKADSLYKRDAEITHFYNKVMAGGKWDHMMDQTHIGYTNWQQPIENAMPKTYKIAATKARLGLAIEGSDSSWTGKARVNKSFPVLDNLSNQSHYFEIFNTGTGTLKYDIKAPSYVSIDQKKAELQDQKRIYVSIDWAKAPIGNTESLITVSGSDGTKITLPIRTTKNNTFNEKDENVFVPQNGYIAMEAVNYSKAVNSRPIFWKTIPNYGKTQGGVIPVPVTTSIQKPDKSTPHLAYNIYLDNAGTYTLNSFISPTIDFTNSDGLKFAISVDDAPITIVNISTDYKTEAAWRESVANSIKIFKTPLKFDQPGKHTIKYWMVTPGVVLQKLVLDLGGLKPSFLGPPETFKSIAK
ncbi:MAG: glycosyl hydrolase 115 family protein [Candidatus Pedobacter colombiensis]|uniref:Glycosyl hydrolase 115 family protein n=1 Tax=Candidatus Pedobacter colombiensis TaxID=3121371 RepID=A0AAJ5W8J1_9SPHI|nr:glycosyl hydrolase 115 family protein [Pedobacter sp.]WEK19899.1 MAG: glycosyl hydrolase 115 family protein [Pedobacter sp.]